MVASAQIPVRPAKSRPAATAPIAARNQGLTNTASAVRPSSMEPTVIMTCRMRGSGADASRTAGRPACIQPMMPPSITRASARPAARSASTTLRARPPERHITSV